MLSRQLKGEDLHGVLAEEQVAISRELYLGITIDDMVGKPILIMSSEGGMDIETIAVESPEKLIRSHLDPETPLSQAEAKALCKQLKLDDYASEIAEIIILMEKAFREEDANLLEINPLCVLEDGRVMACDAKVIIDDYALYRHPDIPVHDLLEHDEDPFERKAKEDGFILVRLGGDIALLSVGAGYGMAIVDAIKFYGGEPANFVDQVGGLSFDRTINGVLDMAEEDKDIKAVVMSFILSASNVGDLVDSMQKRIAAIPPRVPIFSNIGAASAAVRDMDAQTAMDLLSKAGVRTYPDVHKAIDAAIAYAGGK
jgi:succinyl-CoA synthetase beta subunit